MPGTDVESAAILRGVLDRWQAGVDAHEPQRVAEVFTEDAIFQGLRPYSVGRGGVAAYYDSQPDGMTATYEVLETRRLTADVIVGYLSADFAFRDRPTVGVTLGVVIRRDADGWRMVSYQASPRTS